MLHLTWLFLVLLSCQSLPKGGEEGETALFEKALSLKKKSYYTEALTEFKKFKTRYLYSSRVRQAEYAIADIYFRQEEWKKAAQAYKVFLDKHPKAPETDAVLFHLALSYFHQLPRRADRDLSLSPQALKTLRSHLSQFPESSFHQRALDLKNQLLNLQAQKLWLTVQFHLRQKAPRRALPYLKHLIQTYPVFQGKKSFKTSLPLKPDLIKMLKDISSKPAQDLQSKTTAPPGGKALKDFLSHELPYTGS